MCVGTDSENVQLDVLWAAMQQLLEGAPPPVWLLEGYIVLIPKGVAQDDTLCAPALTRAPVQTRPIQLSNRDSKILARVIDFRLQQLAQDICGPQ